MTDLSLIEVIGVACFLTFILFTIIAMIDISLTKLMRKLDIQPTDILMTMYFGLAIYGVYVLYAHWESQLQLFLKLVK
jgi:hypothetical protein